MVAGITCTKSTRYSHSTPLTAFFFVAFLLTLNSLRRLQYHAQRHLTIQRCARRSADDAQLDAQDSDYGDHLSKIQPLVYNDSQDSLHSNRRAAVRALWRGIHPFS